LNEESERKLLYVEFDRLGIPTDELYPLSTPALKQLIDSIKEAILSYQQSFLSQNA
jgi:hypothetical protein